VHNLTNKPLSSHDRENKGDSLQDLQNAGGYVFLGAVGETQA
jgi:hypothetical protein